MKKLLLLTVFLSACTPPQPIDPRDIRGINPAFIPYVQQFEALLGGSIGDIPIQFETLDGYTVGECIIWGHEPYREIKIDPDFWYNGAADDYQRMSIIFHELGHCKLNRGHLYTYSIYQAIYTPTSLMYPDIFFSGSLLSTYNDYTYELFNPAPGSPTVWDNNIQRETCVRNMDHTDTN